MDFIYTILSFIFAIAILVVVHEYGHFWVARNLGVKVLRFSVGFGRPIWTRTFGIDNTELVVAAIPLGGYVKMLDENEGDVDEKEKDRAFNRKPLWIKIAVVIAGPLFNFIFAILAYTMIFSFGMKDITPVIKEVKKDSVAELAGIQPGDRITSIDGNDVRGWYEHRTHLMRKAMSKSQIHMKVLNSSGVEKEHVLDLSRIELNRIKGNVLGDFVGIYPYARDIPPVIGKVLDGPAKMAGIKEGDRIVSVDGEATDTWSELVRLISGNAGKKIQLVISRNDIHKSMELIPDTVEDKEKTIGRINVRPHFPELPKDRIIDLEYSVAESIVAAAKQTWDMSLLTLQMMYKMLSLEVSTKNISGPITIAEYAGKSAKVGIDSFVMFLAVVSISLGVINLLPVPILDGGHLLYYLIEGLKGSPLSENAMIAGQQIGIFLLAGLMLLAFYNDLMRLFG